MSESIQKYLGDEAILISHDRYYRRNDHLTMSERAKINYDEPKALETDLLIYHLRELMKGNAVDIPNYSFPNHNRESNTTIITPTGIIIVEGILIYATPALRNLMSSRAYVDVDADMRLNRRIERDTIERGRSEQSVITQWNEAVDPSEKRYVLPYKDYADFIVYGGGMCPEAVKAIAERARNLRDGKEKSISKQKTLIVPATFKAAA